MARQAAKRRSSPAQLRRYSSRNGTVAMRFRKPEYGALLLELMQPEAPLGLRGLPQRPRTY